VNLAAWKTVFSYWEAYYKDNKTVEKVEKDK
jgi:hypothetical protein